MAGRGTVRPHGGPGGLDGRGDRVGERRRTDLDSRDPGAVRRRGQGDGRADTPHRDLCGRDRRTGRRGDGDVGDGHRAGQRRGDVDGHLPRSGESGGLSDHRSDPGAAVGEVTLEGGQLGVERRVADQAVDREVGVGGLNVAGGVHPLVLDVDDPGVRGPRVGGPVADLVAEADAVHEVPVEPVRPEVVAEDVQARPLGRGGLRRDPGRCLRRGCREGGADPEGGDRSDDRQDNHAAQAARRPGRDDGRGRCGGEDVREEPLRPGRVGVHQGSDTVGPHRGLPGDGVGRRHVDGGALREVLQGGRVEGPEVAGLDRPGDLSTGQATGETLGWGEGLTVVHGGPSLGASSGARPPG